MFGKKNIVLCRMILFYLIVVMILPCLSSEMVIFAKSSIATEKVYDDGKFLTEAEIYNLEEKLVNYESQAGVSIVFVTTTDLKGKYFDVYLEDYSDHLYNQGLIGEDCVLILYGMDKEGRFLEIQGYGIAQKYINNNRIQKIIDDLIPIFREGREQDAFLEFANLVVYYMNREPKKDNLLYHPLLHLGVASLIGLIVIATMIGGSSGRMSVNQTTYMDATHSGVVARRDEYIRTSITKRRKPKEQSASSSGRSGGGISSGGRSHSGGGRRF